MTERLDATLTRTAAATREAGPLQACAHVAQVIKRDELFVVAGRDGQIAPGCSCGQGVWLGETRVVSGLVVELDGRPIEILGATAAAGAWSRAEGTGGGGLAVVRTRLVEAGGRVREWLELTNHGREARSVSLLLELREDGDGGLTRPVELSCTPAPATTEACAWTASRERGWRLGWSPELPPGAHWVLELVIVPGLDGLTAAAATGTAPTPELLAGAAVGPPADAPRLRCEDARFDAMLARGMADLALLAMPGPHGPVPAGGLPWLVGSPGPATLLAARWSLPLGPDQALSTLRAVAARPDPWDVETAPRWLVLLHELWRWVGCDELVNAHWPCAVRALRWLDEVGDADADGFVEDDGFALAKVQARVYDAKRRAAELARMVGDAELAFALEREAAQLRRAFDAAFWLPDERRHALALDAQKRPVAVSGAAPAHLLAAGIVEAPRVAALVAQLTAPELWSGWGLRGLATTQPGHDPLAPAAGAVRPHETAIAVEGLARLGEREAAELLARGLVSAASFLEDQRLPEALAGFARSGPHARPAPLPHVCLPFAPGAAVPLALVGAMLGLEPEAARGLLRLRRPWLPAWLGALEIDGLRIGEATVDLRVRGTTVDVVGKRGRVDVEILH